MRRISSYVLAVATGAAAIGAAQHAAAAPSITVTRVSQTAGQVQIRVQGRGFTANRRHQFTVMHNSGSGPLEGTYSVSADGSGRFNTTKFPSYNNSCLLGIQGTDLVTGVASNWVDLSLPSPCKKPFITVMMHDNERDATQTKGVNFTPPGPGESSAARAAIWSMDWNTGETWYNDQMPVFSDGTTGFHRHWGDARCGHTIEIWMLDKTTQVWSNPVQYRLCP